MNSLAEGVCVALPKPVEQDKSLSVPCWFPDFVVLLGYLDADWRAETETEILWHYVTSPNPWVPLQDHLSNDLVLGEAKHGPPEQRLYGHVAVHPTGQDPMTSQSIGSVLLGSDGLGHAEGPPASFVVAYGGGQK